MIGLGSSPPAPKLLESPHCQCKSTGQLPLADGNASGLAWLDLHPCCQKVFLEIFSWLQGASLGCGESCQVMYALTGCKLLSVSIYCYIVSYQSISYYSISWSMCHDTYIVRSLPIHTHTLPNQLWHIYHMQSIKFFVQVQVYSQKAMPPTVFLLVQ